MNVVPDGSAEHRRVHTLVCGHGVVSQIICNLELLIEQLANIRI